MHESTNLDLASAPLVSTRVGSRFPPFGADAAAMSAATTVSNLVEKP
jgi:hypothetical protein